MRYLNFLPFNHLTPPVSACLSTTWIFLRKLRTLGGTGQIAGTVTLGGAIRGGNENGQGAPLLTYRVVVCDPDGMNAKEVYSGEGVRFYSLDWRQQLDPGDHFRDITKMIQPSNRARGGKMAH